MTELCLKVVNDPAPPPKELRPEIPDALAAIVLKCLEKEPANRYSNVAMLAEVLEPFSASHERGQTDRAWRSLVATGEQQDARIGPRVGFDGSVTAPDPRAKTIPSNPPLANTPATPVTPPATAMPPEATATGNHTWGATHASQPPSSRRPRGRAAFIGGVVVGAVVAVSTTIAVVTTLTGRAAKSETAAA